MTAEQQIKLKQMAEQEAHSASSLSQGKVGGVYAILDVAQTPGRPRMRDRLDQRRADMERRSQQADKMRELVALLDKNPEVARILDLLEELGNH
jgi:hypothetical protein